jgi:hypothetical protein
MLFDLYLYNAGLFLHQLFKTFQNLFGFSSVYLINPYPANVENVMRS